MYSKHWVPGVRGLDEEISRYLRPTSTSVFVCTDVVIENRF